jgi:acyl carrier protein
MTIKKSPEEIKQTVLHALHEIAPEVDLQTLNPDINLREELDIDSMDFRRLMVRLHKELNMDIPEKDYGKLVTLKDFINYLQTKLN